MRKFIISLLALAWPVAVFANIIHIPDDFGTIQECIDNALTGDTIFVGIENYNEHLTIDKTISLIGESVNCSIIDAGGTDDEIFITSPKVLIKSLTLTNAGPVYGDEYPHDAGVKIYNSDSCVIEGCNIIDNLAAGITLRSSSYCMIQNNYISNNYTGIYFFFPEDMRDVDIVENKILKNQIIGNERTGIKFEHTGYSHHRFNEVRGNLISNNGTAFSIIMSYDNIFCFNQCIDNSSGFGIVQCMGGGGRNYFHHNIFKARDGEDLRYYLEMFNYPEYWNSPDDNVGNFWSNYTGSDDNGDGLGDVPHEFYSGYYYIDWLPIVIIDDADGDGITDSVDNCPLIPNADQIDRNRNGIGDVCDEYINGDANGDKNINVGDAVYIVNAVFKGGPPPSHPKAGDANCDGTCNVGDAVYLINHVFKDGPEPCASCP
ncbi:MAG: right-handed parallel beta-helix repeat-containing protein [candidate division Zixibacteria bacterium]